MAILAELAALLSERHLQAHLTRRSAMNQASLATEIRGAFESRPELLPLAQQVRDPRVTPAERDAGLREVVLAYRADHSWSPLLLELLAPAMARRLALLEPQPPAISAADLAQQLVLEVLASAASMPMPVGASFVESRILRRAVRSVVRWLEKEDEHRDWSEPFPERDDEEDDDGEGKGEGEEEL
jgi:hypothetical protein